MKKVISLLAIIFAISTASFAESAIGAEIGGGTGGAGPGWGPWVTMKFDGLPYLGVGLSISENYFNLGLTADWWLLHETISGPLKFYFGLGGYGNIYISDSSADFALGARAPIGLQVFPVKWFEIFLEGAPNLGLSVNPLYFPDWGINGALGARFWF